MSRRNRFQTKEISEEAAPPVAIPQQEEESPSEVESLEDIAKAIGIPLSKDKVAAARPKAAWELCCKMAKHIDTLQPTAMWRTLNQDKRYALKAIRVFIRQLIGEKPPRGEYATLAEFFAIPTDEVLGMVGNLSAETE